jgi:hypothetical protein
MAAGVATFAAGFSVMGRDLGLSRPFEFAALALLSVAMVYLIASLAKLNRAEGCAPVWERFRR